MSQQLDDRFYNFALRTRDFCLNLKWDIINREYVSQVIRSSAAVGANYIEASDSLGFADEKMKLKISRREAKESIHWFKLILTYGETALENEKIQLMDESDQIRKILSAIIQKLN